MFSEPVDQTAINQNTFRVMNGTTLVEGSYEISSNTAIFTPDDALSNNSVYTVQLTTGIKDLSGKNMASIYNSTFTTKDDIRAGRELHQPCLWSCQSAGEYNNHCTVQ